MGGFGRSEFVTLEDFLDEEIYRARVDFQGSRWLWFILVGCEGLGGAGLDNEGSDEEVWLGKQPMNAFCPRGERPTDLFFFFVC